MGSNKLVIGVNDLATVHPELLNEWNYEKNDGLLPTQVTFGSKKKVWWKCVKGHEWQCRINHRSNKVGCPYCSGRYVITGVNDLQTINPDLAKEWNYKKNGSLLPTMVMSGSHKKVWWKCNKCNYEWEAEIKSRIIGTGCPACSGRIVRVNSNDLVTQCSTLLLEWNYDKNDKIGIFPNEVSAGSGKKVWWICRHGHEWQATIAHRSSGRGCPKCNSSTSFPEQAIYYFLNIVFPSEVENRCKLKDKKRSIEVDVYLKNKKIAIEYDGIYWHKNKREKDLNKEFYIKTMGIKFIRIAECNENKVVDNCIFYNCYKNRDKNLTWAIQELFKMLDVSLFIVNVSASYNKILEFIYKNEVENNLTIVNPKLAEEWNYSKNGSLRPEYFTFGSGEKVWWKCKKCGHEWQAVITNRSSGKGCPVCAGKKVLKGFNDVATTCPQLLEQWDYEKNDKLKIFPNNITYGSTKKVWWKCSKCGYQWYTSLNNRFRHRSCPECMKQSKCKEEK